MAKAATTTNPVEALISKFRSVVGDMETVSTDTDLADKVRRYKLLRVNLGTAMELCEALEIEVDEWANKVYEQVTLATDGAFGDDDLRRRVEAMATIGEDFGVGENEVAEIGKLIERYNAAKDAFLSAVEPVKVKRGSGGGVKTPGRFSNNRTENTSDSLRGMKKHLTGVLGKGWESFTGDQAVVVYEEGEPVKL